MVRRLSTIAVEIEADYGKSSGYWMARPYVEAMARLDSIDDYFFEDSGRTVVTYALSNLTGWRGEKARAIKAELKAMLAKRK